MSWRDQLIGLFVFFTALNTTTIGLRLFTRIKLTKGAFGWDDVVLIFSHVSRHRLFEIVHLPESCLNNLS